MSDHNIFSLSFLAKFLNEITAPSISRTLTWLSKSHRNGRYNDRRSQRRHYTRRCYTHAHKIITKGHHRLPRRLARVLLEKSPFHSAQPSNSKSILSVPSKFYRFMDDIVSLASGTVPQHPVPRPSTINAFASELDRGPIYSAFDSDSYRIGIDSMASACMSPFLEDFVPETLRPFTRKSGVTPFGKGPSITIQQMGTIKWSFDDDTGRKHVIFIENSLHVPDGSERLISPQHWARSATLRGGTPDGTCSIQYHNRNVLRFGSQGQYKRTVWNDIRSNVPYLTAKSGTVAYRAYMAGTEPAFLQHYGAIEHAICYAANHHHQVPSASEYQDENLSDFNSEVPQAINNVDEHTSATTPLGELIRWHHRLGHMSFKKLQLLAMMNLIPRELSKCKAPKCATCMYGKMTKKPWRTKGNQRKIRTATIPGECVSVDQLQSSNQGFIAQLKGVLTKRRFKYATVFVDHFSRYKYVHLQSTLTSQDTLAAKRAFEAHCRNHGVTIKQFHADNGRFADNTFINDCKAQGQTITYCGVNAHWQNGLAEKGIRDLREAARTMLLHAIHRWPSAVTIHLWPYALRYAAYIFNNTPFKDGISPMENFSSTDVSANMRHFHTFGCPVYALDERLQANKHIASWNKRARLGVNLGPSPRHARNVSLVLSLTTGLVSPQYHLVHDEFFETIDRKIPTPPAMWRTKAGLTRETHGRTVTQTEISSEERTLLNDDTRMSNSRQALTTDPCPATPNDQTSAVQQLELFQNSSEGEKLLEHTQANSNAGPTGPPTEQEPSVNATAVSNRTGRVRKLTRRFRESIQQGQMRYSGYTATYYEPLHEEDFKLQDDMKDPIGFKASTDPDTMYYHQAMKAPDKEQFISAIVKEINDHITNNHWQLVPKSEVPAGTKVLDSVWSMKRKRDIRTREVYKWKARLNIHGGQQEHGTHYTETYSPVVNWSSVRLITILSIINRWYTKQIDFVLAYPQAPLPYDNYMKLPPGVETTQGNGDTHVLKLLRNIYGGKNSGRIWNSYLVEGLRNIGFVQSKADECVFFRGHVIFLFYVDDGIFAGPSLEDITEAIKDLGDRRKANNKYTIEDQGDIKDYLGINFEYLQDGKIKLSQPHLIDQIVKEVGIKRGDIRSLPALSSRLLKRDEHEPSYECPFNYRKVIGKLNFLEKSSRPDIAYATHQCARFCVDPKESHVKAVIHLAKYLQGTINEGIILDPKENKSFEAFADADFAGNWNSQTAMDDPSTAKSRTGFVITYASCPILWASKLQTCISLSTTEAEYVALSQCLRDTIPIMQLLQELKDKGLCQANVTPVVHCKAFEDNSGALELSLVPKMRPRTKHINNVYHHFRKFVRDKLISVTKIGTEDQVADMFTKPLTLDLFVKHRKVLLGY